MRPSPRLVRHAARLVRAVFGRHTRVTLAYAPHEEFGEPWRAECWSWMRHDRRWELALVVRASSPRRALVELLASL